MGRVTLVIEVEDGKEQSVSFHQEILGGKLIAAAFFDYRNDFFDAMEVEALEELISEHSDFKTLCESMEVSEDKVREKIRNLEF